MSIQIDIEPGSVRVSGSSRHIITDADVRTFGLNDNALKNAVLAHFERRPNDAFLRSPTPWGDLYTSYGWPQVQTVLAVRSSQILEETTRPVMLAYQNFVNNTNTEATYTADMSRSVTNSSSNTWSNTHSLTFEQKIKYGINFGITAEGETTLSYEFSFGQSGTESVSTTLSTGAGVSVVVGPHRTKHAILSASEGRMRVRIRYEAYLTGSTAVNYNPRHNGHHFWGLGIAGVMRSGNISNTRTITEDISLQSYSNGSIVLGEGPAPISLVEAVETLNEKATAPIPEPLEEEEEEEEEKKE